MPRNRECDFCGDDIEPGTGTMLVQKDGSTVHYCSSKCEKNADLGREPRDLSWTESGRAAGGPSVAADEANADESAADAEVDHDDTDIEDQGQDVETGDDAAPDLEDAEDDEAVAGPEGEGAEEAAADADAEAVDDDEDDTAADDEDEEAEEEAEA